MGTPALAIVFGVFVFVVNCPVASVAQENSGGNGAVAEQETATFDSNMREDESNAGPAVNRVPKAKRNEGGGGRLKKQGMSQRGNAKPGKRREIKLEFADDATTPVLVMDFTGGFRAANPDGFVETPALQVFSDGRVLTGRKSPLVKEVEGRIDPVELKGLLAYVVDDCRFFDWNSEDIKKEIAAKSMGRMMDAGTTEFTVNLKDDQHEISVYGLSVAAGNVATIPSVASMVAVSSRCRRVAAMIRIGSLEEATVALQAINKSLAKEHPGVAEFTLEHIRHAEQFVDGRRSATFLHELPEVGGVRKMAFGTYELSSEGKSSVVVSVVNR
jgi:hypothetical protein